MTFGIARGVAQDAAGNVLGNVWVEVRRMAPGYPLAVPIYADAEGATGLDNPFFAGSGEWEFYAVGGLYRVHVYAAGGAMDKTWDNVPVGTAAAADVNAYARAGFTWAPESATTTPPTAGCIRFDDADVSLAQHVYLDRHTLGNSDAANWLDGLSAEDRLLLSTGVGIEVGWPVVSVTHVTSGGNDYYDIEVDDSAYAGPDGPISFGDAGFVAVSQERTGDATAAAAAAAASASAAATSEANAAASASTASAAATAAGTSETNAAASESAAASSASAAATSETNAATSETNAAASEAAAASSASAAATSEANAATSEANAAAVAAAIPTGGATGQVLKKSSGTDYDTEWATVTGTGDVVGPASATDARIAVFDGTTGKLLKDGGKTIAEVVASLPTIIVEPRGRLTLASGVSVSASDLVGQTTIYYTPSGGGQIPIYDGSALVPTDFSQISHPLDSTLTHTNPHAQNGIYDEFVINDAGTVRLGSGPMWKTSGTVTMTVASPCVVTYTAHGAIDGAPIVFTTTGALPTGLTAGTTYFVKSPTTNTFNVAATPGGAAINTTGTQSGTHTATLSTGSPGDSRGRGSGAGTTELEFIQGIPVNKNAITIRYGSGSGDTVSVPARQATYVGSFCATANGQATDSLDRRLLYNAFNQAPRPMRRTDLGTSWTYSTNAYRQWHGDAENKLAVLFGLAGGMAEASFTAVANSSTATKRVVQTAIGINSTSQAITSTTGYLWLDTTPGSLQARYRGCPGLGRQDIIPLENGGASDTQTWYGTNNDTTQFRTGIVGSVIY